MRTRIPEELEHFYPPFSVEMLKSIDEKIANLFNQYTKDNDLSTIYVIVQFKGGKQKYSWASLPTIRKIDQLTHIVLYKMKQQIIQIN